jgi:glycine dehydrogenase subunit 1
MSTYLPNTPDDVRAMLDAIGVKSVEDLFAEIPADLRLNRPLQLDPGVSEPEMARRVTRLAARNKPAAEAACFLGGGVYDHLIPAALDHLVLRGDFFTAYTPYQAEISQGTLQVIYEYQSLICGLTGMDQSNASMYEGASALAEAVTMALAHTGRTKVLLAQTVHPEYRQTVETLLGCLGATLVTVPSEDGAVDLTRLAELARDDVAAVVVQYPTFFGTIEDLEAIGELSRNAGALFVVATNPIALGMLTPPSVFGADIVCGEGQPLGIPMGFGGPFLGFLAAKQPLLRRMPGRIAGATVDKEGRRGYVLTLQAREQHIRREKASSNICSNQALMALNATLYLSLLGGEGVREVARQCFQKAHYLKMELGKLPGVTFPFSGSFFHEFVVRIPNARKVLTKMAKDGIYAGLPLDTWFSGLKDHVLVAVTEKRTREELDSYVATLGGLLS